MTSPSQIWAIVAHDAGGAEVLSSYVRQQGLDCRFSLQGPACAVFERKLSPYKNLPLEVALKGSNRLLCGTGWQSDQELQAIKLARAIGIPSIAWLDHWVNYRARFERDDGICLPDEIWVSDPEAFALAEKEFPEMPIREKENPYFLDIATSLQSERSIYKPMPGQLRVLYVCEPVREHALLRHGDELHWNYTEEQALRYFLTNVASLELPIGHILIRPHPSESVNKYRSIVDEFLLPISFSQGHTLSAEVYSSDCIVGCNSMAMVVGLIAGRRVISCIPPGGPQCILPQKNIERLSELNKPPQSVSTSSFGQMHNDAL
jgi:hypothetical protein